MGLIFFFLKKFDIKKHQYMYSGPKRNSDGKSSELVLSPSGIPAVRSAPGVGILLYLQMVSSRCLLGPRGDRGAPGADALSCALRRAVAAERL